MEQIGMRHQGLVTCLGVGPADGIDYYAMVSPDFAEIVQVGVDAQTNGFIGIPISFQDPQDEGVLQAFIDQQVQGTMFNVRDANGSTPQPYFGLVE
jgi:hypothetical protein